MFKIFMSVFLSIASLNALCNDSDTGSKWNLKDASYKGVLSVHNRVFKSTWIGRLKDLSLKPETLVQVLVNAKYVYESLENEYERAGLNFLTKENYRSVALGRDIQDILNAFDFNVSNEELKPTPLARKLGDSFKDREDSEIWVTFYVKHIGLFDTRIMPAHFEKWAKNHGMKNTATAFYDFDFSSEGMDKQSKLKQINEYFKNIVLSEEEFKNLYKLASSTFDENFDSYEEACSYVDSHSHLCRE